MSFRKKSSTLREALRTIERICALTDPDEKNPAISDIYMIAHSHIGDCGNPHNDWKEEADKLAEDLKDI